MSEYFAFQWHITNDCDQRCKHCYIFSENNCKSLDAMNWEQMQAVEAQGFRVARDGGLYVPEGIALSMEVPDELVPYCPVCGKPMSMNLRADDTFVQDGGWYQAQERYHDFLRRHEGRRTVFLELGVGGNTPGIIKYPFWNMTAQNPAAVYAWINNGQFFCPEKILGQAVRVDGDIGEVLAALGQDKR